MTTSTSYIENPAESMTNSSLDPLGNPQGNPQSAPQGPQTGQPGANGFNPEAGFAPDPMAREAFRPGGARPDSFGHSRAEGKAPNNLAAMVQRLLKNKIMVGLVLVFLFIFTVGQFYSNNESNNATQKVAVVEPQQLPVASKALRPVAQRLAPPTNGLTADMAKMFVAWWIGKAMDYSAPSATNSHNEAFTWMTPQAVKAFKESLWSPQIAAGITQGQVSAAFQAVSVQPQAINPDGSIVVTVLGTLMIQEANNPTPASQQIVVDFLVKKDASGNCRVAGLYNRTTR